MRESEIQQKIQSELSKGKTRLFRNPTSDGWSGKAKRLINGDVIVRNASYVKAGLVKGSSDLIGWHKVKITPEMIGQDIAVFTAIEVKSESGKATEEQVKFIKNVQMSGGIAGVARSVEEAKKIIEGENN